MVGRTSCYFSGQVQGVGFRYTVRELADGYEVAGFVKNLGDGRVELVMEGELGERRGLLEAVKERMAGYFDQVEEREGAATGEYRRFEIRY